MIASILSCFSTTYSQGRISPRWCSQMISSVPFSPPHSHPFIPILNFPQLFIIFPDSLPSKPRCLSVLFYTPIFSPFSRYNLGISSEIFCLKSNSGRLWAVCANLSTKAPHICPLPKDFWHAVCLTPVDAPDYPSILIGLLTSLLMTFDQSISVRQFASFAGSLQ